jgi:hypothetical protein
MFHDVPIEGMAPGAGFGRWLRGYNRPLGKGSQANRYEIFPARRSGHPDETRAGLDRIVLSICEDREVEPSSTEKIRDPLSSRRIPLRGISHGEVNTSIRFRVMSRSR